MNARDLQILERIFTAEIENRLPFQTRGSRILRLQEQGFVQPMVIRIGSPPCRVEGWCLTEKGRFEYCQSCGTEDSPS